MTNAQWKTRLVKPLRILFYLTQVINGPAVKRIYWHERRALVPTEGLVSHKSIHSLCFLAFVSPQRLKLTYSNYSFLTVAQYPSSVSELWLCCIFLGVNYTLCGRIKTKWSSWRELYFPYLALWYELSHGQCRHYWMQNRHILLRLPAPRSEYTVHQREWCWYERH